MESFCHFLFISGLVIVIVLIVIVIHCIGVILLVFIIRSLGDSFLLGSRRRGRRRRRRGIDSWRLSDEFGFGIWDWDWDRILFRLLLWLGLGLWFFLWWSCLMIVADLEAFRKILRLGMRNIIKNRRGWNRRG